MNKIKLVLLTLIVISCNSKQEQQTSEQTPVNEEKTKHASHIMVGEKIKLSDYKLNTNNNKSIEQNKLILIDFWATWCGPCIASFPHLEELQQKYKDHLQIIAVSDESNKKIENFLDKRPFDLAFFNNEDRALFERFGVRNLPTRCLISSDGEFIWIGKSDNLEPVIDQYLKDGKIDVDDDDLNTYIAYYKVLPDKQTDKKDENVIFSYTLKRATDPSNYSGYTGHKAKNNPVHIEYTSIPLIEVIVDFKQIDFTRIRTKRKDLDTILVDIYAKSRSENIINARYVDIVLDDLQKAFDFNIIEKEESTNVNELIVTDKDILNSVLEPSGNQGGMIQLKNGKYEITRISLVQLAGYLEKKNKSIGLFTYNANDAQKYTFSINQFSNEQELITELNKVGLSLKKVTSKIKFLDIK